MMLLSPRNSHVTRPSIAHASLTTSPQLAPKSLFAIRDGAHVFPELDAAARAMSALARTPGEGIRITAAIAVSTARRG